MTVDQINMLISQTDLEGKITATCNPDLHGVLNQVDSAIGADTEWLSSKECGCLWHIGKTCYARRAVGARVRMLEEIMARQQWEAQYKSETQQLAPESQMEDTLCLRTITSLYMAPSVVANAPTSESRSTASTSTS